MGRRVVVVAGGKVGKWEVGEGAVGGVGRWEGGKVGRREVRWEGAGRGARRWVVVGGWWEGRGER